MKWNESFDLGLGLGYGPRLPVHRRAPKLTPSESCSSTHVVLLPGKVSHLCYIWLDVLSVLRWTSNITQTPEESNTVSASF